jgi:hypothetical protein
MTIHIYNKALGIQLSERGNFLTFRYPIPLFDNYSRQLITLKRETLVINFLEHSLRQCCESESGYAWIRIDLTLLDPNS